MNDDQDDDKPPRMALGDLGTIGIAMVFFLTFLWLMFGPSPFAGLYDKPSQAQAPSQEVTVSLPEKPKRDK